MIIAMQTETAAHFKTLLLFMIGQESRVCGPGVAVSCVASCMVRGRRIFVGRVSGELRAFAR